MNVGRSKIQGQINNEYYVRKDIKDSPANVGFPPKETDIKGEGEHIDPCHQNHYPQPVPPEEKVRNQRTSERHNWLCCQWLAKQGGKINRPAAIDVTR